MSDIKLHKVSINNMFGYGKDNYLQLDNTRITQLKAINGVGKTSIALAIQELLYNKNIKAVKKGDILNRYIKDKTWSGELDFTVNNIPYIVKVSRVGATSKVQLLQDGIDISEHKVLDTYKKIRDILNLDFEVFAQITYQSSTDLLDFLKATDTNRKKFLINLFNLEKYTTIGETIKVKTTEINNELSKLQGELKSIEDFLETVRIPEYLFEKEVPAIDPMLASNLANIEAALTNINDNCKSIDKNNMYIKERNNLSFDISLQKPEPFKYTEEYQTLKLDLTMLSNEISKHKKDLNNVKINDKCTTCGQSIDNSHLVKIKQDLQEQIQYKTEQYNLHLQKAKTWSTEVDEFNKAQRDFVNNQTAIAKFEQLSQLIDKNIPTIYPDRETLFEQRNRAKFELADAVDAARSVSEYNKRVSSNNAKVDTLKEQKSEFTIRQTSVKSLIIDKSKQSVALNILKKAFSTSGIVAFKLENLAKELETTINYYLTVMSDGQFQVEFSLDKEKLNISVINNGISAPIETTSGGEFSRIQTSVLLAIRHLLSTLGGSSINLLFLDEIMAVLDDAGKESLIEVLQRENDLNVFLIAHEFTHPLIEKINIVKENNISSIQN